MSWCRRWRTSTKESLVLWAQECQSLMLRCSATLTMFRVTLVWIVLPSRPLLSCISETYMYAWLPGLLPPESYRTCYYINYVPKSLMYLDGILAFYCWIGSLGFTVGLVLWSLDVVYCFGIAGCLDCSQNHFGIALPESVSRCNPTYKCISAWKLGATPDQKHNELHVYSLPIKVVWACIKVETKNTLWLRSLMQNARS